MRQLDMIQKQDRIRLATESRDIGNQNEVIVQSVRAIYFIAAMQVVVSLLVGQLLGAADGLCLGLLGFWLARRASIVAAALIVVLAVVGADLTATQFVQGRRLGGLVFAAILIWAGGRAAFAAARLPQVGTSSSSR